MLAPEWVTKELERIHKRVRLGWWGWPKKDPLELNVGTFMILQLYHWRDAENTIRGFWNERGPIYGSNFDRLMFIPVMIERVTPMQVYQGTVISRVRELMKLVEQRIREQRLEKGKAYKSETRDRAEAMVDYMRYHNRKNWQNQSSDRTRIRQDLTQHEKDVLDGKYVRDLTNAFMPPEGSLL